MLCVTGNEATTERLAARIERTGAPSRLQELRLDALQTPLDAAWGLIERHAAQLVVCCRPTREGGAFSGNETDRLALLQRAWRAGAAYVDIEGDCSEATLQELIAAGGPSKLVLSHHDFQGIPEQLEQLVSTLQRRGPAVAKVAVTVDDAADLVRLRALAVANQQPTVLIGMGLCGLLTRVRYPSFASPWTYVKADADSGTAPGQLTLEQAVAMGLPESASTPFFALVGGTHVADTMRLRDYNQIFRARGHRWSYVPVATERAPQTFDLLRELGAIGAVITTPHQDTALALAGADPNAYARRARAADSLRFVDGRLELSNTAVAGIYQPLRDALRTATFSASRALVLGSGPMARAALIACHELRLAVSLSAPGADDAVQLSLMDGDPTSHAAATTDWAAWDALSTVNAEVLINATTATEADRFPWPEQPPPRKLVVFDLAATGEHSQLLRRADGAGALTLGAEEMWVAQSVEQLRWLTGQSIAADELRALLPDPVA